MYNRDPFALRRSAPLAFLHRPASSNVRPARKQETLDTQYLEQVIQGSQYTLEDRMSYPVPRVAHSQNTTWQHAQIPNAQIHDVTASIQQVSSTKKELPMYKDKPYNYSLSRRRPPFYKRNKLLPLLLGLLGGLLYWIGIFPDVLHLKSVKGIHGQGILRWFSTSTDTGVDWEERRSEVRDAFLVSWEAYEKHAWGYDEFHPITKTGKQMVPNGMGWIIVDALDTMMLMNLTVPLSHAREWISTTLDYDQDQEVSTFETTIRMMGGLLSAHYLSSTFPDMAPVPATGGSANDDLYLEKATDLADRLLGAYESRSGVPFAHVNLRSRKGSSSHENGGASSTAEATSVQLEMKYLAKLTGEKQYWDVAEKVMQVVDNNGAEDGLVPIFIYADLGVFRGKTIRLGSRGDSYYGSFPVAASDVSELNEVEYLIKQYLQTSKQEPIYHTMWDEALAGVRKNLLTYTTHANLLALVERPKGLNQPLLPKMDHLVCFMPGTIALAVTGGIPLAKAKKQPSWGKKQEYEMEMARQLMKTCWGMYKATATGLAPEIVFFKLHEPPIMIDDEIRESPRTLSDAVDAEWRKDYEIRSGDTHNLQRPETVESLFYMWRITGDVMYREWGWKMFESFVAHTQAPNGTGFSSLSDTTIIPPPMRDNMESFWLAETLKYFYLLFGPDDILPLDQIVLNTEAHPFPRFDLGKLFYTGWQRKPRDADGKVIGDKVIEENIQV